MAERGPWDDFQSGGGAAEAGPWQDFQQPAQGPAPPTVPMSGVPGGQKYSDINPNPNADPETGILHAFGQGFQEGVGPEQFGFSDQSTEWLRKAGYFTGKDSSKLAEPFQGFFEGITRPAAAALDAAWRGSQGVFRGAQEAAVYAGVPRDIAALPEAFAGMPGALSMPRPEVVPAPIRPIEGSPAPAIARSAAARTGIPEVDAVLQSPTTAAVIDNAVIDRSHTVPYMAGGSTPLEDPTVYIDKHVPKEQTAPSLSDPARTVTFDPAEPWAIHENVEQHTMEILMRGNRGIVAYHGSPYDFEKFEVEKSLSPPGGINFTQNEELAREQYAQGGEGTVYRVRIHVPTDQILYWDKPLSEQSSAVKQALAKTGKNMDDNSPISEHLFGFGGPSKVRDLGISGIKYEGEGGQLIVFDESKIEITHKNGMPVKLQSEAMSPEEAYRVAHFEFAEKAEQAWYRAHDIDQEAAEKEQQTWLPRIQHEDATDIPENLYDKPYPHANVKGAQQESVEEARPSPEEVARAKDIIRKAAGPPITADLRVAKDLGIIGPERPSIREGMPEEAARNAVPSITAYHGSPYSFDAFDIGKIGTGEGAQAYGHGLYFAENEAVAKDYERQLSDKQFVGKFAQRELAAADGDATAAAAKLRTQATDVEKYEPGTAQQLRDAADLVDSGWTKPTGITYQVRIHADREHFLDWDKPLSEQNEHVQKAVKPLLERARENRNFILQQIKSSERVGTASGTAIRGEGLPDLEGDVIHQILLRDATDRAWGGPGGARVEGTRTGAAGAAEMLREAGIPGIKYLDQGSRTEGEGTRNYVVFDHNDVEITHRNGEPVKPPAPPPPSEKPPEPPPERTPWRQRFDQFVGKLKTGDDVKALIQNAADEEQEFPVARKGDITLAEAEGISAASGIPTDKLDLQGIGRLLKNDAQVRAAMRVMLKTGQDLHLAMQEVAAKGGKDDLAELTALQEARMRHSVAVEQIAGLRAEWGRTGNVFQEFQDASKEAQSLGKFLADKKGESIDDLRELAKRGAAMDPRTELPGLMNESRKPPTFWDKLHWYWVNGLISGLITHTGYGMANYGYAMMTHGVATPLAAMIGQARTAIGAGEADRVFFGEGAAAVAGFHLAGPTAFMTAGRAAIAGLKTPLAAERTLVEQVLARGEKPPKSLARNVEASETPQERPIGGKLGRAIGIPGDMAGAIHGFYKIMGYDASVAAQAYRQAIKEGLNPLSDGFADRVDYWRKNPTEAMMKKGIDDAYAGTFMQDFGTKGQAFNRFVKETPGMRWVFPFRHIPLNLLKATYEWSPLAFFDKDMRANLMGENGGAARDLAAAKMIIGTSIMSHFVNLYMNGQATGEYPDDPKERDAWRLSGKQPNSLLIDGEWWSMQRIGPAGQLAQLGANIGRVVEGLKSGQDDAMVIATTRAVEAAGHFVSDAPGFQTLQNYFDSRNDPKKWTRFVASEAGTLLPYSSFEKQGASFIDPYMREVKTFLDGIKYSIPGARQTLLPKRDWSGQPVENPGFESVIRAGTAITDPVDQELARVGVHAAPPSDRISGVKLSPQLYDQYQATAGPFTRAALERLVTNPSWPTLPAFQRAQVMRETITATRKAASAAMQMAHPELIRAAVQARVNRLTGQPAPQLQQ